MIDPATREHIHSILVCLVAGLSLSHKRRMVNSYMPHEEAWLLQEKYVGKKTEGFFADLIRLHSGEPLAYIIGSIPFLNTTIYLGSRPLIPRTETEFWVEKIITKMKTEPYKGKAFVSVLDLCAGSGCIGVALLKAIPNARVDFAEIDPCHHVTIQKNIRENNIDESRTKIVGGDLFEHINDTYDFILSNPPYIDPLKDRTQKSVTDFEPPCALYGGKEGTDIIFKIIEIAPRYLNEGGTIGIEHEPEQTATIRKKALEVGFCADNHHDQYGVLRYTTLYRQGDESM